MRKLLAIFVGVLVSGLPLVASAQFQQNQVVTSPYGGFLVATGTSGLSKISATTTPYFSNFFFGSATGTRLAATTLCLSADCRTTWPTASGSGNVSTSSAETATYIPIWTSTAATPATLSGGSANFTWIDAENRLNVTNASTSLLSVFTNAAIGGTATTTINSAGTITGSSAASHVFPFASSTALTATNLFSSAASTTSMRISNIPNALVLTASGGLAGAYGGASCTNQVPTSQSATGAWTCSNINNAFWSGTDLSVANGGTGLSTFGGTNRVLYTTAADTLASEAAFTYDQAADLMTLLSIRATASSTIGGGTQTTGLTISGGATTTLTHYFADKAGVGTTTPWAKLSVQATANQTNPVFQVASSSSGTTYLTVSGTGFGTTTLSGLNISGSATSTSNVGFNITAGCFAVNGTCVGAGGAGSGTVNSGTQNQVAYYAANGTAVSGTDLLTIQASGASSTRLSVFQNAYFGATATSSFSSTGALTVPSTVTVSGGTILNSSVGTGVGYNASPGGAAYSSGTAYNIGNASAFTSGSVLNAGGGTTPISSAFTGALIRLNPSRTSGAASVTDTGNFINLQRNNTSNGAGTFTVTGDLVSLESKCVNTAGLCSDSSNVLSLLQSATSSTGSVLDIFSVGNGDIGTLRATSTSADGVSLQIESNSSSRFALDVLVNAGTSAFKVLGDGKVGVSSSTPWRTFSVVGTMANTGMTAATGGTNSDICISATGDFINESTGTCVVSSKRWKHDIKAIDFSALELVSKLRPVSYSPNSDDVSDFGDIQYGLIAEEVADVDPRFAKYGTDGLPRTLDDRALLSITIKALQEQQKEIEILRDRIKEIESNQ